MVGRAWEKSEKRTQFLLQGSGKEEGEECVSVKKVFNGL
jgi:hypothetical protein